MEYRELGKTGLSVSEISVGTVSLGMDYGIKAPGEFKRPSDSEAVDLLKKAYDSGINLFDTAPGYSESERLTGKALGSEKDCLIATKISFPPSLELGSTQEARSLIRASVEQSARNLQRSTLDILQIHNATEDILQNNVILETLTRLRDDGLVRFLGASIYTEEEALTAIRTGCLDALQVPFSILDQRMRHSVARTAEKTGVGLIVRSVFLKGVLTDKAAWLPPELKELKVAAGKICRMMDCSWPELPQYALRYALSISGFSSVLVGVRKETELLQALDPANSDTLPSRLLELAAQFSLENPRLYNPAYWPVQ